MSKSNGISDHNNLEANIERVVSIDADLQRSVTNELGADLVEEAKAGVLAQQQMGTREGFRKYPKAAMWSIIFSTAIVMEGYDLVMINSFYAQPQFKEYYGQLNDKGEYYISPNWQTGLGIAVQIGSIIGLQLNGYLCERIGYKKTMIGALILMIAFIFIVFFSINLPMLLVGEMLCGLPWGVFQTLTTAYASEVCPVPLRPYLTTYVNLCWVFGQFVASGILRGFLEVEGTWAFRGPFAVQWFWPIPILAAAFFAPESPWWLVRQGRIADAKKSLARFASKYEDANAIDRNVAMIVHTNELEKAIASGTSYIQCFKGVDLRRTEIGCIVWLVQAFCGAALMGYSTYFYQQAGLSDESAFDLSFGQYALGAVGTMASWFTMQKFGRRTLYLYGEYVLEILLLVTGALGFVKESTGRNWAIGSCLLIFTFVYDFTVGPVCYCLVAEMSSTRLRAKSVVLARNLYNIGGIVNGFIMPRMLNPEAWNWGAKSGFFWAGMNFLCIVWIFFRLPEPKGRTYGELDILFENKVPARKFSSTAVDQFAGSGAGHQMTDKEKELAEHYATMGGGGH